MLSPLVGCEAWIEPIERYIFFFVAALLAAVCVLLYWRSLDDWF